MLFFIQSVTVQKKINSEDKIKTNKKRKTTTKHFRQCANYSDKLLIGKSEGLPLFGKEFRDTTKITVPQKSRKWKHLIFSLQCVC